MTVGELDPFHLEVARVALRVAQRYGFVLGGGLAWVLRGLVQRPTEDVDLFSDTEGAAAAAAGEVRAALHAAGYTVEDEDADSDLAELFEGFEMDQREFLVSNGNHTVRLSLSRLDRRHSPVVMDVGPTMHLDDLIATKVAARSAITSMSPPPCGITPWRNCLTWPASKTLVWTPRTSSTSAATLIGSMTKDSHIMALPRSRPRRCASSSRDGLESRRLIIDPVRPP